MVKEVCDGCKRDAWRVYEVSNPRKNSAAKVGRICLLSFFSDIDDIEEKVSNLKLCTSCLKHLELVNVIGSNLRGEETTVSTPVKRGPKRGASTPMKYRVTPIKDTPPKRLPALTSKKQLFSSSEPESESESAALPTPVPGTSLPTLPVQVSQCVPLPSQRTIKLGLGTMSSATTQAAGTKPQTLTSMQTAGPKPQTLPVQLSESLPTSMPQKDDSEERFSNKGVYFGMDNSSPKYVETLKALEFELASVVTPSRPSILGDRSIEGLEEEGVIAKVIQEMCDRCPLLVDLLVTLTCGPTVPKYQSLAGPMALLYAILVNRRNKRFDRFQRLLTLVLTQGKVTIECLTTMNRMGVSMSYDTKLKMMEECGEHNDQQLKKDLASPDAMPTLCGDNFDIRLKPRFMSTQKQVKDFHFYYTMMLFSRIPGPIRELSVTVDFTSVPPNFYKLTLDELDVLKMSYRVLMARILSKSLPQLEFIGDLYPRHIPHEYSEQMSKKTNVRMLRMIFKDEKKLEDCVVILDQTTQQLRPYLTDGIRAAGLNTIPYHGDQLTRVRLQSAKSLRQQALEALSKFSRIGPFICTLWHTKQDFLEKSYKSLWAKDNIRDPVTLRAAASFCKMKNVNGKVKDNYRAHEHLLLTVGELTISEQAMEYFMMKNENAWPSLLPTDLKTRTKAKQKEVIDAVLDQMIEHYGYLAPPGTQDDCNPPPESLIEEEVIHKTLDTGQVLKGYLKRPPDSDDVLEYSQNLARRALHLMFMNDVAAEADLTRTIISVKVLVPYFLAHSRRSKYFVETLDFLLKTTVIGSPADRLRILEGAYCNMRGGPGQNHETDLVMENKIKEAKAVTKASGAHRTEKAILRTTAAASTVKNATQKLQRELGQRQRSNHRTVDEGDRKGLAESHRRERPFRFKSGRKLKGKPARKRLDQLNQDSLKSAARTVSERLARGWTVSLEESDDSDSEVIENEVDEGENQINEIDDDGDGLPSVD